MAPTPSPASRFAEVERQLREAPDVPETLIEAAHLYDRTLHLPGPMAAAPREFLDRLGRVSAQHPEDPTLRAVELALDIELRKRRVVVTRGPGGERRVALPELGIEAPMRPVGFRRVPVPEEAFLPEGEHVYVLAREPVVKRPIGWRESRRHHMEIPEIYRRALDREVTDREFHHDPGTRRWTFSVNQSIEPPHYHTTIIKSFHVVLHTVVGILELHEHIDAE